MASSRSLNKVMIIGNLSRDPEVRYTPNGSVVCTFGVATNTSWKNSEGEIEELTEWHNIVCWNKLAEICAQILAKGMLVYVEGELRTRSWEDENSVKHFKTEVKIQDMKLLDNKGREAVGLDRAVAAGEGSREESSSKEEAEDSAGSRKEKKTETSRKSLDDSKDEARGKKGEEDKSEESDEDMPF